MGHFLKTYSRDLHKLQGFNVGLCDLLFLNSSSQAMTNQAKQQLADRCTAGGALRFHWKSLGFLLDVWNTLF